MSPKDGFRLLTFGFVIGVYALFCSPSESHAQQARGLFFSVFGENAPSERGDNNHVQVIYFDIPASETRPIYLRIFDAEVGGYLDERHGQFNSKTRYVLLGGSSASRVYGGSTEVQSSPYLNHDFSDTDIIHDRTFGVEPRYDGRYFVLGDLPLEQGFETIDGYRRFAFFALGIEGNDGNFFDFVLSYDPNDKIEPENYRMFTYNMTLRIPNSSSFKGQIRVPVQNRERLHIATFSLNNEPIAIHIPFQEPQEIASSPAGEWRINTIDIPNPATIESIGFNFLGSNYNNTFSFMVLDEQNAPIAIPLPILDYEPVAEPVLSFETGYAPDDCHVVSLEKLLINGENFRERQTFWVFDEDTLQESSVQKRIDEKGYHSFSLNVRGLFQGERQTITIRDSVFINTPPTAWAGGDRRFVAGRSMAFDGTVSEDPDGRITKYLWDFGDGNTATGARVDHIYTRAGEYTVTLRVIDNSNSPCSEATATAIVRVNLPPIARFTTPDAVQLDEVFMLDASESNDPDGEITEYRWEIGDTILDGAIVEYTATSERNIPVKLTVTDDAYTFNSSTSTSKTIRVNRRPIANAGADKHVSPNRPATFVGNQSRDLDGRIVKYEWLFPEDIIVEGATVQQGIAEPGDHVVYLRVTDNDGGVGIDSMNVRVNFPPIPVIAGNRILNDGRAVLSASESNDPDGTIISYEWNMGDGRRIVGTEAVHTYRRPGTYTVQLTIVDDSGTFSSVQSTRTTVVVNQLPIARITSPTIAAPEQTLAFDGSRSSDPDGDIIRYVWDFGDGNALEGKTASHAYEAPGTYQVQLAVFDDVDLPESVGYAYTEIVVKPAPILTANYPTRVAPGTSFEVDLSDSHAPESTIKSYYWYINGSWRAGEANRNFLMEGANPMQVRFAVENAAGLPNSRVEGETTIYPNKQPIIAGIVDISTHQNTVYLDASASSDLDNDKLLFTWDFGDGKTGEGPVIVHTYEEGGQYQVRLTVDDQQNLENSTASTSINVHINRNPRLVVSLPEVVCKSAPFAFDASESFDPDGNTLSFSWDFGNNEMRTSARGEFSYADVGTFSVTVTSDDGRSLPNSVTKHTQTIKVVGAPIAVAGENINACITEAVVFDGSSSSIKEGEIKRYLWVFGDGFEAEGVRVSHRFARAGTYAVSLTVECEMLANCENTDTDEITVTIIEPARAQFSNPATTFEGRELSLDPSNSIVENHEIRTIRWEIGDSERITWSFNEASHNWVGTSSVRGDLGTLPDQTAQGRLPITTISPSAGTYTISLHVETNSISTCNTASVTREIVVIPEPQIQIASVGVLSPNESARFTVEGSESDLGAIRNAIWDFDGERKTGLEAIMQWSEPGTYSVRFMASAIESGDSAREVLFAETEIRVNMPPVAVINGPSLLVRGETATYSALESFDADGEISEYNWYVVNGTRSDDAEFTYQFTTAGKYVVTLVVRDNDNLANSRTSVTKEVEVVDAETLQSSLPATVCVMETLNLNDLLSITESRFAMLDVLLDERKLSFAESSALQFTDVGTYTLLVRQASGNTLLREDLRVIDAPFVGGTVPERILLGGTDDSVLFDASESVIKNGARTRIFWDFGDGTTAVGQSVRHEYRRPGTYTVQLSAQVPHQLNCNRTTRTYTVQVVRE